MFKKKEKYLLEDKEWKEKNKLYLKEVQSFLDKVDNVSDESLRQKIVSQKLRCDKVLTEIKPDGQIFNYILGDDGKKIPKPENKDIVKKRGKKKPPDEKLYQQYTIPKSNGGKKKWEIQGVKKKL